MPSVRLLIDHVLMRGRISVLRVLIGHLSWPGNTQGVQGGRKKKNRAPAGDQLEVAIDAKQMLMAQ